jgi:hypothetical protein
LAFADPMVMAIIAININVMCIAEIGMFVNQVNRANEADHHQPSAEAVKE